MPLEDPQVLKAKNQKRLRDVKNVSFALGINVTAPSPAKDYLRIIAIILIVSSWVEIYGHVCYILRFKNNIIITAESICTTLQILISIFKLTYILFVQHRFYEVLKLVETHELIEKIEFLSEETPYNKNLRKEVRRILDDCWRIAKGQFNFYMIACSAIISVYFFNAQAVNAYNWFIGNTNHTNILPYPTLFPFWEDKMNEFPHYAILTFVGGSADYIAGIGATSFDGIFIIIALHGVALLRVLRRMIIFTTSPDVPKNLRLSYLRQCIDHYNRTFELSFCVISMVLTRYCREFNNLYFHISLVQFLLSLVILGVVMFQASVSLEDDIKIVIRMAMYMAAAGYEVVIYCLNGQLVFNESEALPLAWYECEWYNESEEFKLLIKMMIMRTNRVFYMRASWFSTMSLPTLLALIKTSGSYFLLLRNLAI